jgi:hypothetical protein
MNTTMARSGTGRPKRLVGTAVTREASPLKASRRSGADALRALLCRPSIRPNSASPISSAKLVTW